VGKIVLNSLNCFKKQLIIQNNLPELGILLGSTNIC